LREGEGSEEGQDGRKGRSSAERRREETWVGH